MSGRSLSRPGRLNTIVRTPLDRRPRPAAGRRDSDGTPLCGEGEGQAWPAMRNAWLKRTRHSGSTRLRF